MVRYSQARINSTKIIPMLTPGAIYRFNRNRNLRYYKAFRTRSGIDYLFPISVDGSKVIDQHASGRRYVILYFVTQWGKLGARGYWVDTGKPFQRVFVSDATPDDLDLVTEDIATLPDVDRQLDNVLNRDAIQLDMEVWGDLFTEE